MAEEEAIEHFGVKGMRWGVHKKPLTQEKARKKLDKLDSNLALEGYSLQAHGSKAANRYAKKKYGKNYDFKKLTTPQKKDLNRIARKSARRKVLAAGAFNASLMLGTTLGGIKLMNLDPEIARGGKITAGLMTANVGRTTIHQLRALKATEKLEELRPIAYPTSPSKTRR